MLYDPKWEKKIGAPVEEWRSALLKAASLIRERGHTKHEYEDGQGRLCLHGAIRVAMFGSVNDKSDSGCEATKAVCRYLRSIGRTDVYSFAGNWNDEDGRSGAEVIAVLESAAALAT